MRLVLAGHGRIVEADRLTVAIAPRKVAQKNVDVNALRPRILGLVNCRRAVKARLGDPSIVCVYAALEAG